jgi:hypothetical protein
MFSLCYQSISLPHKAYSTFQASSNWKTNKIQVWIVIWNTVLINLLSSLGTFDLKVSRRHFDYALSVDATEKLPRVLQLLKGPSSKYCRGEHLTCQLRPVPRYSEAQNWMSIIWRRQILKQLVQTELIFCVRMAQSMKTPLSWGELATRKISWSAPGRSSKW